MTTRNQINERDQLEMLSIEQLVSENHLVRKPDAAIDFSFHAATDERGFVLGTIVTPGNVHDSDVRRLLVEKLVRHVKKPLAVAADATYKTPTITKFLFENQMLPVLP